EMPAGVLYSTPELKAEYLTGSGVQLRWQDNNTGETGYEVYRRNVENQTFTLLTTTAANTTQYHDNSVIENNTYVYKIRPVRSSASGYYSKEVEVRAKPVKKVYVNFGKNQV